MHSPKTNQASSSWLNSATDECLDSPERGGEVDVPGLKYNDSLESRFHTGGFDSTPELIRVPRAKQDQESSNILGTVS